MSRACGKNGKGRVIEKSGCLECSVEGEEYDCVKWDVAEFGGTRARDGREWRWQ